MVANISRRAVMLDMTRFPYAFRRFLPPDVTDCNLSSVYTQKLFERLQLIDNQLLGDGYKYGYRVCDQRA
jgi:hypothetical protein